jgi:23S rRNA (guanosine2251-2'-O)-methyltransferase
MRKQTSIAKPTRPAAKPAEGRAAAPRPPKPAAAPRPPRPDYDHESARIAAAEHPSAPWLWGRHAVMAALANPERKLLRLVATEEVGAEIAEAAAAAGRPPQIMPREEIAKLLPREAVHQGLALQARPLRAPPIEDLLERVAAMPSGVILALDQVTDPHNIGAVLRSAAAFGALALVLPDRNAPDISGTLAKSASGAVEHVPVIRVVNLNRTLESLKKAGFWTIGLDGAAERTLASHAPGGKVCLVLGSEGDGLRRLTREACDLMARLPTSGPIASLNVSNAAAIALYELARNG